MKNGKRNRKIAQFGGSLVDNLIATIIGGVIVFIITIYLIGKPEAKKSQPDIISEKPNVPWQKKPM